MTTVQTYCVAVLVECGLNAWHYCGVAAEWGSRRTDLVLIGMGLDESQLRSELEACALTDDEMLEFAIARDKVAHPHKHQNLDLRFKVGSTVECCVAPGQWLAGHVVAHDYSEENWPSGQVAPYQIKLANGGLIFAPLDNDDVVRAVV